MSNCLPATESVTPQPPGRAPQQAALPRPAREAGTWEDVNNAYLAAGLGWLAGRLAAGAGTTQDGGDWWAEFAAGPGEVPPALELLGDRLGLSRFERLTLLLCVAMELDPAMAARLGPGQPTFALALSTLPEPAWDALSPQRPLRYWRLVEVHQAAGQPLVTSGLRADERIVNFVKGLNQPDDRLDHLLRPVGDPLGALCASQDAAAAEGLAALTAPGQDVLPLIEILGTDPAVRRGLAFALADRAGLLLYELATGRLPRAALDLAEVTRLWTRETILLPLALYIDAGEATAEEAAALPGLLRDLTGPVFVGCREPLAVPGRPFHLIEAHRPTPAEQEELWAVTLAALACHDGDPDGESGADGHVLARRLSGEFDLNQTAIREAGRRAQALGGDTSAVWRACQSQTRPRLEALAKRQQPVATWDDLVLPAPEAELLHYLADQVRGRATVLRHWGFGQNTTRGSGITALFAGQSGTGKSMAAEVIAGELGLAMYRIDLAGVVSKYIGETERNLRRVFDAADEGGCLLLFDEADALFGRRSEVKDSHDRYANIEVNYLLQRMEDYRGIAILTTNQRRSLDHAFLRRLRLVINFPFPSPREREVLWRRAFPAQAPVAGLDLGQLTRLATTGGMIRNIALNAAFCAAGRGIPVTTELVLDMARAEFRKLQLPVSDNGTRPAGEVAR